MKIRELKAEIENIPDEAEIYWYGDGSDAVLRAEWMDEELDFQHDTFLTLSIILSGGTTK
jgi:hypothetical protein